MTRPASLVFLPLVFAAACAGNEDTTPTGEGGTASLPAAEVSTPAEAECADLTGEATAPIRMDDVYFDPRCAIVSGDQKLEFVNEGKSRHSFTIPELDIDVLSGRRRPTSRSARCSSLVRRTATCASTTPG